MYVPVLYVMSPFVYQCRCGEGRKVRNTIFIIRTYMALTAYLTLHRIRRVF